MISQNINKRVVARYEASGWILPNTARLGEFTDEVMAKNRRGIEAYTAVRIGRDHPEFREIVNSVITIGSRLSRDMRDDFYSFARTDRFLGKVLQSKNPKEMLRIIDDMVGQVVEENRLDFLYGLVPLTLDVCGNEFTKVGNNLDAVRNLESLMPPESRKWLYTHEEWAYAGGVVEHKGIGCRAVSLYEGSSDEAGKALFRCIKVAEGLNEQGGRVSQALNAATKMNFYMNTATEAMEVHKGSHEDLEKALKLVSNIGERVDDEDARRYFYQYAAPTAISTYGKNFTALGYALRRSVKAAGKVTPFCMDEFTCGAVVPAVRTFGVHAGLAESLETVASARRFFDNRIYESLYYRDVVPHIFGLGYSARRVSNSHELATAAMDSYLSTNPEPTEAMEFISNVVPKTFQCMGRYYPTAGRDQLVSSIRSIIPMIGGEYVYDFMNSALPSALETFSMPEQRRAKRFPILFTRERINPIKQLADWTSTFIEVGNTLDTEKRMAFYQTELSEFYKIVAEFDRDRVIARFGGDLSLLHSQLSSIARLGAGLSVDERQDFYHFSAARALEVAAQDTEGVGRLLEAAISRKDRVPDACRREYWRNAVDNIITASGGNLEHADRYLEVITGALGSVPTLAHKQFLHDFVPAVALSSIGNVGDFTAKVQEIVDLAEHPDERIQHLKTGPVHKILDVRKPNVYGVTLPRLILKYVNLDDVKGAVEHLLKLYTILGADEAANLFGFAAPRIIDESGTIGDFHRRLDSIVEEHALPEREQALRATIGDEVYDIIKNRATANGLSEKDIHVTTRATATQRENIWAIRIGPPDQAVESYVLKSALHGREGRGDIEAHIKASTCLPYPFAPKVLYAGRATYGGRPIGSFILNEEVNIPRCDVEEIGVGLEQVKVERIVRSLAYCVHKMNETGVVPGVRIPHFHPMFFKPETEQPICFIGVEKIAKSGFKFDEVTLKDLVRASYDIMNISFTLPSQRIDRLISRFNEELVRLAGEEDAKPGREYTAGTLSDRYERAITQARTELLRGPEAERWETSLGVVKKTRVR